MRILEFLKSIDRRLGGYSLVQLGALVSLCLLIAWFAHNTTQNLALQNIGAGFDFLREPAGFEVSLALIAYDSSSSFGRVLLVGILNTIFAASIGIIFASLLGFVIGILRLSPIWLLRKFSDGYIETIRNIPILLQILFWYGGILQALPHPRQSFEFLPNIFLNNRGLFFPLWRFEPGAWVYVGAILIWIVLAVAMHRRQMAYRRRAGIIYPIWSIIFGMGLVLGVVAYAAAGVPFRLDIPDLRGFNFQGGGKLIPEFMALVLALSTYTAAFIAEIVRAGIMAVSKGQTEAGQSLGLSAWQQMRFIILPQSLRVIIPPLTSQYLNLTKNTSLGAAIAYPELVAVFAGTSLAHVGQAVEIIAITMAIYLSISLLTSYTMNRYNRYLLSHGGIAS